MGGRDAERRVRDVKAIVPRTLGDAREVRLICGEESRVSKLEREVKGDHIKAYISAPIPSRSPSCSCSILVDRIETAIMATVATVTQTQPSSRSSQHSGESIVLQTFGHDSTRDLVDGPAPENAVEAIPDGDYGWTVVTSCAVLLFWVNGYNTAWGVLQTALLLQNPDLHTDIRTVTFIGSLSMACLVAFGIAFVRLMRAYGARVTCAIAVVLYGLGPILTSFTLDNIGGLFATSGALVGLSSSLVFTATNAMPIQWFSSRLGTANGLIKAGGGVGATVLPMAAQAMIDKWGIPWTFRAFGLLIIATGLPTALLLKEHRSPGQSANFDWSLLKNAPFLTLALAGAIGVFALFVPPFFLPLFANSIGLSGSTGAALVAGFGGATAAGRLVSGWTCDRIGAFNTLAISAFVNSLTMLAIWPASSSLVPLLMFAIINGCANGSIFVALPTAVAALAPSSAAASISMAVSFWTPGYLLGSPIAGMLIQATGAEASTSIAPYRAAIFYAAGTGMVSTFLIIFSRAKQDRKFLKRL